MVVFYFQKQDGMLFDKYFLQYIRCIVQYSRLELGMINAPSVFHIYGKVFPKQTNSLLKLTMVSISIDLEHLENVFRKLLMKVCFMWRTREIYLRTITCI